MSPPRVLPPSPVLRQLRSACLHRPAKGAAPADGWCRWPSMPFTIADPSDESEQVLADNPVLTYPIIQTLVKRAATSVRLTLDRVELPESDMIRPLVDTYRKTGKRWPAAELLWWVEKLQYWLQPAARVDTDALLLAAGVNPNAVANRTYDPATAFADLHVASYYLDSYVNE